MKVSTPRKVLLGIATIAVFALFFCGPVPNVSYAQVAGSAVGSANLFRLIGGYILPFFPIKDMNGKVVSNPVSFVVSTTTSSGDYTDIPTALAALPASGGTISITCGTFSLPSGISWTYSNVTLQGQGDCTQINIGSNKVGFYMGDTTQRSLNHIKNLKINENGTAGTGTCVDFSYFAISTFEQVDCSNFNIGYIASTTGSLYNSILNPRISVSGVGSVGYEATSSANFNLLKKPRILTDANSTGIAIDAHDNSCENCNVETGALIGVYIGPNGGEANFPNIYLEANQTNLSVASGVRGVFITGFVADATTADFVNAGALNLSFIGNLSNSSRAFELGNYSFGTTTNTWPLGLFSANTGTSVFLNIVSTASQASEEPTIDIGNSGATTRTFARVSATGGTSFANSLLSFWTDNGSGSLTRRLSLDKFGHRITLGTAPSCGTGCSTVVGDDSNMRVVTGSSVSSATVNFANTYTNTPICIANEESGGAVATDASSTPTTVVLEFGSALVTKTIAVHCEISNNFTY